MAQNYVGKPRIAGEDCIARPSERTIRARQSITPAPEPEPAPAPQVRPKGRNGGWSADQTVKRDMWVYRHITEPMDRTSIIDATGLSPSTVERALESLMDGGRVMVADGTYTRVKGMGYPKDQLDALEFPGRSRYAKTPKDDVLAPMAGDKMISQDALDTYKRAYEDIARLPHYGVGEIDSAIKALEDVLRRRVSSVRYDCPVCGKAVEVSGTEVHCKKCAYTIDAGDIGLALRMAGLKGKE